MLYLKRVDITFTANSRVATITVPGALPGGAVMVQRISSASVGYYPVTAGITGANTIAVVLNAEVSTETTITASVLYSAQ